MKKVFFQKNVDLGYILANLLLKNNPNYVIIDKQGFSICKQSNNIICKQVDVVQKTDRAATLEKGIVMCKASEIGKIVVNKCLDRELDINTQKLQKLLVLIQIECIKNSGYPFFSEDIRIWDCGVAIKEVDEDFRASGTKFNNKQIPNIVLLDSEEQYIDTVLDLHGNLTASELNALPVNQKVISLGIIKEGDTIPHVSALILTEAFAK